jgi:hypothetical protein
MLCQGFIVFLHSGQKEKDLTIEMFLGMRYMQTFKKEPTTNPKIRDITNST